MATIKAVSSGASIGRALDYVTKEEKTELKLMTGYDCSPAMVKEEMKTTKELWGKTDGRTYLHFVQSWHEDEPITHEKAHEIGCELVNQLRAEGKPFHGYEVIVVTHTDRGHTHNHFIANSVNTENGKKIQFSPKDLQEMKDRSDELCREAGLSICEKGKTFHGEDREAVTAYDKNTYHILSEAQAAKEKEDKAVPEQEKKPEVRSWVYEIGEAAQECRTVATSKKDFAEKMAEKGYSVDWQDNHKYIVFIDLARQQAGEKKCKVRNKKLEDDLHFDFSKEGLERDFERNLRAEKEFAEFHGELNKGTARSNPGVAENQPGAGADDIGRFLEGIRAQIRNAADGRADREAERERLNREAERRAAERKQQLEKPNVKTAVRRSGGREDR